MRIVRVWLLLIMLAGLTDGFAWAFAPGQSVQLDLDMLTLPEWTVTASPYGGKLLLSDSPEMVPAVGIMYQDVVQGNARLFFHHVNDTHTRKRIVALLKNSGNQPVKVSVYRWGLGGPGYNYVQVGKAAQTAYMRGTDLHFISVPAHGTAMLDEQLSNMVVKPNMLVNGIYDFTTDAPVKVTVMMMPVSMHAAAFAAHTAVLPKDAQRLRGTFDGKDRLIIPNRVYHPRQDGRVAITLADNHIDRYAQGLDATDGSKVENYGNYGIMYHIFLPSDPKQQISYYLNPRGGEYAGAMAVKYRQVWGDPVPVPGDKLSIGNNTKREGAVLGVYEAGQSLWLTFSPPGAANLPVKLILAPQ